MSNIRKFSDKLSFLIEKAQKPLIWIETFDYGYILESIKKIHPITNDILIWNASTCEISNISNTDNVVDSGYLGKALKIINSRQETLLIARVSESMFEKDGDEKEERLISRLQEHVYLNKEKEKECKQTVILVSAYHFDVPGLEHICEHLSFPLPDIEDIDEELGLIHDPDLRTLRDYEEKPKLKLTEDEDRIIGFSKDEDSSILKFIEEDDNYKVKDRDNFAKAKEKKGFDIEKTKYYFVKDEKKGVIRRNKNGIVERIIKPRNPNYPFSSDFLQREKFESQYQELTEALRGMCLYDIREFLNSIKAEGYGKIKYQYDDYKLPESIRKRKKQIVTNSGLLEVIDIDYDGKYWLQVADIDNLLNYIDKEKQRIDNPNNYPPKLPKPKGILLVGAPGCGKSESAKAIASKLEKPLYRLNIGSLLGHKYGQSENRFIEALQTADASAPCVLWIDEIEKAFAGAGNESENDDTLTHIVGHFLTWMQEHKTMVYLVATANDLSRMKPEMLRKGRWDERFYLTYPSIKGCEKILYAITSKKFEMEVKYSNYSKTVFTPNKDDNGYKTDDEKGLLKIVTSLMHIMQMSGAEIENIIVETIKMHPHFDSLSDKKVSQTDLQPNDIKWSISLESLTCLLLLELQQKSKCPHKVDKDAYEKFLEYMKALKSDKHEDNVVFQTLNDIMEKTDSESYKTLNDIIEKIVMLYKEQDNEKEKEKYDPFLEKKVEDEIQNIKIKKMGTAFAKGEEENLKGVLFDKFRDQYHFRPASNL